MNELFISGINLNELLLRIEQIIEKKLENVASSAQIKIQSVFLSRKEVTELLKVSLPTLHEWTKAGWLQSYKIGNRVLYKPEEVENALTKVQSLKFKRNIL